MSEVHYMDPSSLLNSRELTFEEALDYARARQQKVSQVVVIMLDDDQEVASFVYSGSLSKGHALWIVKKMELDLLLDAAQETAPPNEAS